MTRTDLVLLLILVVVCLALRLPVVDRVALNPDESQYEATASYLLATDTSAFSLTYGVPGTIALYRAVGTICGPYSMWAMRVLVTCVCVLMAILLYLVGRGAGSSPAGFLAALVFVHHNAGFEGLSANREWFAGGLILLGAWLCLVAVRAGSRQLPLLLLSGFVSGLALWFKLQAGYIVLTVPLFLLWRAWAARSWRRLPWDVGGYAVGGVLATAIYLGLLALGGGLSGYLEFISVFWRGYVDRNAAVAGTAEGGATLGYLGRYLGALPGRSIFLVAYATATAWIVSQVVRRLRRRPTSGPGDPTIAMFVIYLGTAMLAVQMGQRFFAHYYLLMLPPIAALFGGACGFFLRRVGPTAVRRGLAAAAVALLLVDLAFKLRGLPLPRLLTLWPASAPALVYLLLVVAWLGYGATRPVAHLRRVALGLLLLEVGLLVAQTQLAPPPGSLPHHRTKFSELTTRLRNDADAGDRLFVWGWLPEIYSLSRLEAASQFTISQYIVGDYYSAPAAPALDSQHAEMLMRDLRERRPRFVVDAWRRSWTMAASGDPSIYRLERYPEFELPRFLERHYDLAGTYDGCDLYVRRPVSVDVP